MNTIYKTIITVAASALITSSALAGSFGIGVSGSSGQARTSGSEERGSSGQSDGSGSTSINVHKDAELASIFVEYVFDNGAAIGIDLMPGETSLGSKTETRTDAADAGTSTVTQKAAAQVRDFQMLYLEAPVVGPLFVTAGLASVTVNTQENLGTGSTYKNVDVLGAMAGVGAKMNLGDHLYVKGAVTYTDFEQIDITAAGTENSNHISANVDVIAAKASVGFKF
jgi:outer membrane protein W